MVGPDCLAISGVNIVEGALSINGFVRLVFMIVAEVQGRSPFVKRRFMAVPLNQLFDG